MTSRTHLASPLLLSWSITGYTTYVLRYVAKGAATPRVTSFCRVIGHVHHTPFREPRSLRITISCTRKRAPGRGEGGSGRGGILYFRASRMTFRVSVILERVTNGSRGRICACSETRTGIRRERDTEHNRRPHPLSHLPLPLYVWNHPVEIKSFSRKKRFLFISFFQFQYSGRMFFDISEILILTWMRMYAWQFSIFRFAGCIF